jgi:hypothetical protein
VLDALQALDRTVNGVCNELGIAPFSVGHGWSIAVLSEYLDQAPLWWTAMQDPTRRRRALGATLAALVRLGAVERVTNPEDAAVGSLRFSTWRAI